MSEAKKTNGKKELAKRPDAGPLAKADFGEDAGLGFDNQTANDMAIPFIGLLQQLSPQVQKGDPGFVEGAEAGQLFNTVTQEIMSSPVIIVPCCTENVYVEWTPRKKGGGFVEIHEMSSRIVATAKANSTSFNRLVTEDGNDLVETFYIYALLLEDEKATEAISPIVIAFTATKIKVYKRLMTALRTIKGQPPLFAFRLAVSSVNETNKAKQPYCNFKIEPTEGSYMESVNLPGSEREGLLVAGRKLTESIRSGTVRAAHDSQATVSDDESNNDEVF